MKISLILEKFFHSNLVAVKKAALLEFRNHELLKIALHSLLKLALRKQILHINWHFYHSYYKLKLNY